METQFPSALHSEWTSVRRSPRPVLYVAVAIGLGIYSGVLLRHNSPLLKVVGVLFLYIFYIVEKTE
jgi:hypothetical protein